MYSVERVGRSRPGEHSKWVPQSHAKAVAFSSKPHLYFFCWPSCLGGADTKLAHLFLLLHKEYSITAIPNRASHLRDKTWTTFLSKLGIKYCLLDDLGAKLDGFAVSLCNRLFFPDKIAHRAREKGLKVIWSSEMMWHHEGELEAVKEGILYKALYVSTLQQRYLSKGYQNIKTSLTGNYIDPGLFPFSERRNKTFAIGRLSRPDPLKYPEDFPVFYEALALPDTRFRVMAWDKALSTKYKWHRFDDRWDLLAAEAESQVEFLRSLDLFVYPLGHQFKESWGRSTVEAMLTGSIPLVPPDHNFENLLEHGESGFICRDFLEYQEYARLLCADYDQRRRMSRKCREHAVQKLCVKEDHLKIWREVFQ